MSSGRRRMKSAAGMVTKTSDRTASMPKAWRQLKATMMAWMTRGSAVWPSLRPEPPMAMALPRFLMNQLAMAMVVPNWTPATATPRPTP